MFQPTGQCVQHHTEDAEIRVITGPAELREGGREGEREGERLIEARLLPVLLTLVRLT